MSATGADIADALGWPAWSASETATARTELRNELIGHYAAREAAGAMPRGGGTVALHVRAGLNEHALHAGVLMAGTAAEADGWAGPLLAARGAMVLLESDSIAHGHTAALGRRTDVPELLTAVLRAVESDRQRTFDEEYPPVLDPVDEQLARRLGPHRLAAHLLAALAAGDEPEEPDEPGGEPDADEEPLTLRALAERLTPDAPGAVAVARPDVPALTGEALEDTRRLFALTVGQLAELLGVTERQAHRYLREGLPDARSALADALVAVGLTVVGGLGPRGAQRWLFSGAPTAAELARAGRLDELRARADALRDSPAT